MLRLKADAPQAGTSRARQGRVQRWRTFPLLDNYMVDADGSYVFYSYSSSGGRQRHAEPESHGTEKRILPREGMDNH